MQLRQATIRCVVHLARGQGGDEWHVKAVATPQWAQELMDAVRGFVRHERQRAAMRRRPDPRLRRHGLETKKPEGD